MRSRSAALELTLLAVLVMTVLLISFTWLSLRWQRSWLLEEVQRGVSLASDTLQSSLRNGMLDNRRDQISDTIDRVSRDTRIRQIRIISHRGQVMLSAGAERPERQLDADAPGCTICHTDPRNRSVVHALVVGTRTYLESDTIRAFTPILAEQGCITQACHQLEANTKVLGIIDLDMSLREAENTVTLNQSKLVMTSIVAVLLGGGLLWLAMTVRFRRPMNDVLRGIEHIGSGNLKYSIPMRTPDEFGQLARSFNAMSRQLSSVQDKLIQSARLISVGRLAAGVAHEINNPISGVLSYAEDLLEDADPSDPRRKDYEVIVRETLRCRHIVRSLLDYSRQDKPAVKSTHPRVLIETALDVLVRQAEFRNIRFVRDIEEGLPSIEVDPVQIEQVLVNLMINAQQAMPSGGTITLGARSSEDGGYVEFSIQDEGIGIAPEIRQQIFEPFFSTKAKTGGLGLPICLGVIQRHGGTIDLESKVGKGTTFRFKLPIISSQGEMGERGINEQAHTGRG